MTNWQSAYEDYGGTVRAYLRSRLRRTEDAEDLLQETFARAMASPVGIRKAQLVRPYLMQTAHNLLVNHLRRATRIPRVESDLGEDFALERVVDERSEATDDGIRARELRERLRAAMGRLTEDHRIAFELGMVQRLPYAQIARQQNWSISRVKINVFRARKRVLQALAEEENP